jgi:hypothetical protein
VVIGEAETGSPRLAVAVVIGFVKAVLSTVTLLAVPLSLGVLYLAYLASIPPCSTSAWYNCPPDPATTVGLGLMGLAVPIVAVGVLAVLWSPRLRHRWGGWVLATTSLLGVGMWLVFSAVP